MLADYKAYSHGHIDFEFIDPGSVQALEEEAQSFNIPSFQVQAYANDKIEVVKVYMGVVFIYGDKQEIIPTVTETANLEYEITSLIHRLTTPNQAILGIASTGNEQNRTTMQQLYEALGRIYDIRPVSLDEPIDDAYDGIFVIAPRQPFTDWQLFNLDQFVMKGGTVGMFMNAYEATLQSGQQASLRNLNVNKLLNAYGLVLNDDMVIDAKSNVVTFQSRQGLYVMNQQIPFPYFPIIENMNRENIITRDLQRIAMFFPSSVDTTLAAEKGYDVHTLLYSSEMSGRKTGSTLFMSPQERPTPQDLSESYIPLAAAVIGNYTSAFAESGPPDRPADSSAVQQEDESQALASVPYDGPFVSQAETESRVLLVGDGNMATDEYAQNPQSLLFALNAADWLLQSGSLISIRSKQIPATPLKDIPAFAKKLVKWINRIGPVMLVIALGLLLWQSRRIKNKALMSVQTGGVTNEK